jgi:hypothetical protein
MNAFQLACYVGAGITGALFLGFLAHANPNLFAIHLLANAAIVGIFAVNGLGQSSGGYSYYRRIDPVLINFAARAIAVLLIYWAFVGVGHWTYVPPEEVL